MTTEKTAKGSTSNKGDWAKAKPTGERQLRTLATDFFKFENVGDSIEGYLVDKSAQRMRPNSDGSPNIIGKYKLQLETETGEAKFVEFLGGTDIDAKLGEVVERLERGESPFIRLEYVGTERTSGGNSMKKFLAQVAD
jgi:hypothetical protein